MPLPQVGVEAVVQGVAQFQRDMSKIGTSAQDINRDLSKWAQAQQQGFTQGAAAADQLATKYAKLAEQQRAMATAALAQGKIGLAQQHVREADGLSVLASRYREVADTQKDVNAGQNKMTALSDMVQAKWAQMAAAGGILVGAFRGLQQVMAMGAEGAAVLQTAASFERLMKILGSGPDILDKLRDATRGTVSDQELMSSTMTVLAGGSEEVNKKIVEVLPQLLAMAKASNTLNPSLGSTAFLFDSITRGIKRSSPLILDNLGIVVKLGPANEAYAASLGKTVDELTAEEKILALLNGTLLAGENLIAQVGGTTESAVDPTAQLDAAMKNLGDSVKAKVAPPVAQLADVLTLLVTREDKVTAALRKHEAEVRSSAPTFAAYEAEMKRATLAAGRVIDVENGVSIARRAGEENALDLANSVEFLDDVSFTAGLHARELPLIYSDVGKAFVNAGMSASEASANVPLFNAQMALAKQRGEEVASAWDAANTSLGKTIQTMLTNIAWVEGGGAELQAASTAVMDALKLGAISPEEAKAMLEPLGVEAIALQTELGLITVPQAAQQAADLLKTSLSDGAAAVERAGENLDNLPREVQTSIKVAVNWYLRDRIPGYAHGGQFRVPGRGGPDTQPVNFMATPGEIVTITPPNFSAPSMTDNRVGVAGDVNINRGMDAQAFDAAMRNWLGA